MASELKHEAYIFRVLTASVKTEVYSLSLHDALPILTCIATSFPWDSSRTSRLPTSAPPDRKSTRLNSSHTVISYAVFCLKKKKLTPTAPHFNAYDRQHRHTSISETLHSRCALNPSRR